jgi:hypothetical protein
MVDLNYSFCRILTIYVLNASQRKKGLFCVTFNEFLLKLILYVLVFEKMYLKNYLAKTLYEISQIFRIRVQEISRNYTKLKSLSSLFRISRNITMSYCATTLFLIMKFTFEKNKILRKRMWRGKFWNYFWGIAGSPLSLVRHSHIYIQFHWFFKKEICSAIRSLPRYSDTL